MEFIFDIAIYAIIASIVILITILLFKIWFGIIDRVVEFTDRWDNK